MILEIFLPIMLFWEARNTSLREVRKSLRAIITSGTVLVIVTAFAMAGVLTHFFHIDWGTALIIGAALAPTDATAVATLNGKLPKRSITVLKAESLINDGTTLVVFALAIQVAGGADLSVSHAGGMLAFSFLCGGAVGSGLGGKPAAGPHRQSHEFCDLYDDDSVCRFPPLGIHRDFRGNKGLRRGGGGGFRVLPDVLRCGHH